MRTEKVARDGKRKNVRDEDTYAGGKKRMFLGNLYDEWKKIGRYDVLREMGDSCEWAFWMAVRRGESNCRSIIIELLNGRAYCVGRWDYVTGSDSCSDEWWRCKKMGTRQTDLLSYVIYRWCVDDRRFVVWEVWLELWGWQCSWWSDSYCGALSCDAV